MKNILGLLIILTFSNCRYFNVSPVNGITTKNLSEKPLRKDFVGNWKLDKISYELIEKNKYEQKIVMLKILENGNFEAINFPNFIETFPNSNYKEFLNKKGTWEIEKDFGGENWVLGLNFPKEKSRQENSVIEFELFMQNDKLILWKFIGDPDSGERLLFEKE